MGNRSLFSNVQFPMTGSSSYDPSNDGPEVPSRPILDAFKRNCNRGHRLYFREQLGMAVLTLPAGAPDRPLSFSHPNWNVFLWIQRRLSRVV